MARRGSAELWTAISVIPLLQGPNQADGLENEGFVDWGGSRWYNVLDNRVAATWPCSAWPIMDPSVCRAGGSTTPSLRGLERCEKGEGRGCRKVNKKGKRALTYCSCMLSWEFYCEYYFCGARHCVHAPCSFRIFVSKTSSQALGYDKTGRVFSRRLCLELLNRKHDNLRNR